ncbi:hypothetical protein PENTCL1PPCAC_14488, partial [Pristionchus entomophagus]
PSFRSIFTGIAISRCNFSTRQFMLTWHPTVLYLLIRHPGPLSKEIRSGYIVNQVCLMLNEWVFCGLVRVYPLVPYPALYCDGPLCQLGLPQQAVLTFLAAFVILPNPPFEFLLLCMHQKMITNTNSRARLSTKAQNGMMYILIILLILNVVGFGVFGTPASKSVGMLEVRSISRLVGEETAIARSMVVECYFLAITLIIVFPVVVALSIHATLIMHKSKKFTTDRTIRLQNRIMSVLLIQMCFILNPMPLSIVFLFKNGANHKV